MASSAVRSQLKLLLLAIMVLSVGFVVCDDSTPMDGDTDISDGDIGDGDIGDGDIGDGDIGDGDIGDGDIGDGDIGDGDIGDGDIGDGDIGDGDEPSTIITFISSPECAGYSVAACAGCGIPEGELVTDTGTDGSCALTGFAEAQELTYSLATIQAGWKYWPPTSSEDIHSVVASCNGHVVSTPFDEIAGNCNNGSDVRFTLGSSPVESERSLLAVIRVSNVGDLAGTVTGSGSIDCGGTTAALDPNAPASVLAVPGNVDSCTLTVNEDVNFEFIGDGERRATAWLVPDPTLCTANDDCSIADPTRPCCALGFCSDCSAHNPCTDDNQCDAGLYCSDFGVCSEGVAGDACDLPADCQAGFTCTTNICTPIDDGDVGDGDTGDGDTGDTDVGDSDVGDTDVGDSDIGDSDTGGPACTDDTGCSVGEICETNVCVLGCREDVGCDLGQICESQSCIAGCRVALDCSAGQSCVLSQCVDPLVAVADDFNITSMMKTTLNLLNNDTGALGAVLVAGTEPAANEASFTFNPDGTVEITAMSFVNTITIQYRATQGATESADTVVTIHVLVSPLAELPSRIEDIDGTPTEVVDVPVLSMGAQLHYPLYQFSLSNNPGDVCGEAHWHSPLFTPNVYPLETPLSGISDPAPGACGYSTLQSLPATFHTVPLSEFEAFQNLYAPPF